MELFHEPKIDWMGIKWYFISLSLALALIGIISIVAHRGLVYGIDFRGGTLVYVKFTQAPNVDAIRHQLDSQNLRNANIQRFGIQSDHEVMIGLDLQTTTSSDALDTGKHAIITGLTALYGAGPVGKVDFNNASPRTVAERLTAADPLGVGSRGMDAATKTYSDLAESMVDFRNSPPHSGLITDLGDLSNVKGVTPTVISAMAKDFYLSSYAVKNTEIVGPKVGSDLRRQALYVTLAGLAAMLVYIWFRFELVYGVAAVIATFHDVIITLGFFSLLHKEITLTVIAALLTLVGYSMNDTIVVFDRIRENVHANKREEFSNLVNHSINQTLSRTMLTSGLTFLAVLSLFLFGGEVIHGFAFALVVGVIIGTYSSIFIASPIVVYFYQHIAKGRAGQKVFGQPAAARR
jgi:preprotein translocase subunit SecF